MSSPETQPHQAHGASKGVESWLAQLALLQAALSPPQLPPSSAGIAAGAEGSPWLWPGQTPIQACAGFWEYPEVEIKTQNRFSTHQTQTSDSCMLRSDMLGRGCVLRSCSVGVRGSHLLKKQKRTSFLKKIGIGK